MLSVQRFATWLYIALLGVLPISQNYLGLLDELTLVSLLGISIIDSIINNAWRKYIAIWVIFGIMTFYIIYSTFFLKFNTLPYILYDAFLELKPFVAYFILFAIGPDFTKVQCKIISYISIVSSIITIICLLGGHSVISVTLSHPAYGGLTIMVNMLTYLYVNIAPEGKVSKKIIYTITVFLLLGILCGRSKYYGELVLFIFLLYVYRPGMFKKIDMKHLGIVFAVLILVITVSWSKIQYYFITGNGTSFDPKNLESFARPVLYATSFLILIDYFPFGSGLASFASHPSAIHYSNLYYEYGIDKVYGLSKNYGAFICDAYYPTLSQFGVVGIILFICFLRIIYKKAKLLLDNNTNQNFYPFIISVMIITISVIESTSGTSITQAQGMELLMLAGMIASKSKRISQ